MKTLETPPEVIEAWRDRLQEEHNAMTLAMNVLSAWESIEEVYDASKGSLPDELKLRVRRIAERYQDTLEDVKATFLDAEAWLEAWTKAGQARMRAFADRGAAVPAFEEDVPIQGFMPRGKAVAILDEALGHIDGLVWDGPLYEAFTKSKEN